MTIVDDDEGELAETFTVELKSPTHATLNLANTKQTITISEDNDPALLTLQESAQGTEPASAAAADADSVHFDVTMSAPRSYDVTVKYATSIEEGDTAEAEDFKETKGDVDFCGECNG